MASAAGSVAGSVAVAASFGGGLFFSFLFLGSYMRQIFDSVAFNNINLLF